MTSEPQPAAPAMVLAGLGGYVPQTVVTNDDLSRVMDTSDEWISSRTGIRQRHQVAPGQTSLHLAIEAGQQALKHFGDPTGVDAVVLATMSPDRLCPGTAPEVASALGLGRVPAFDVSAVCSGFVYALGTAHGLIATGIAQTVLVIGTEAMSAYLTPEDRNTAVIFGDGAGAVVVRGGTPDELGAFGGFDLGSDGEGADLITVNGGGSRIPPGTTETGTRSHYMQMQGREVYRRAIPAMADSTRAVLKQRGWTVGDLDMLIAHQANVRIINAVARALDMEPSKAFVNLDQVGNTSAASIPLAMHDAHLAGAVKAGDKVVLTAFGAGLTWGSTTLVWPDLPAS